MEAIQFQDSFPLAAFDQIKDLMNFPSQNKNFPEVCIKSQHRVSLINLDESEPLQEFIGIDAN